MSESKPRSGKLIAINDPFVLELINDPLYDVREDGTIWTRVARTGRVFVDPNKWRQTGTTNQKGYLYFRYHYTHLVVHRVIYAKFNAGKNGNPPLAEDLVVNHEDGNGLNNLPSNLTIMPQGKNTEHAYRVLKHGAVMGNTILNWEIVRAIREGKKNGMTHRELVEKYGISKGHVSLIVNNKIWMEGHNYHEFKD